MTHVSQKLANIIHPGGSLRKQHPLAHIDCASQTIEGLYDTHPLYVDLLGIYLFFLVVYVVLSDTLHMIVVQAQRVSFLLYVYTFYHTNAICLTNHIAWGR